jgi:hypothetical protein
LKQAGQIKNQVASLVSTKNIKAAQEITLNFESSLRAHELILEKISSKNSDQTAIVATNASVSAIEATSTDSTSTFALAGDVSTTTAPDTASLAVADTTLIPNTHIAALIATIKGQIATTTAARAMLQAAEADDRSLDKDKLLARLSDIKLKTVEIKRIASTTPVSTSTRMTTSLSYINESDNLVASASQKIASSSYAAALTDLQKASEFLVDAETLISAEYRSDPSLKSVIDEALSVPSFSQASIVQEKASSTNSSTSTVSASTTTVVATSTPTN